MNFFRNNSENLKSFFVFLISPISRNKDSARREFILNILLIGIIVLAISCIIAVEIDFFILKTQGNSHQVLSEFILYGTFVIFLVLLVISKLGKSKIAAYSFIGICFLFTSYVSWKWGVYTPQGLLAFALIIIMTGTLIGTRFSFFIFFASSITIFSLFHLQKAEIIKADLAWINEPVDSIDVLIYILTLFVICLISWLSNRETEKSLRRAKQSEHELKKERDLLEIKVHERTEELRMAQYEKMRQLYRFAEFGRLSSGLFHDLTNYLTALSLNLEKAKTDKQKESASVKTYLNQACKVSNKIEDFIDAIQKQLQKQETKKTFSVNREVTHVLKVFNYRLKKEQIELSFKSPEKIYTFGNPLKFNQVITNIISNAIDSYLNLPQKTDKKIQIDIFQKGTEFFVKVQDWGSGISKENLQKVFDPFFTTKNPDHGTGIGLSTTKEIIMKDLGGKIEIESQQNIGTVVTIIVPMKTDG